MRHYRDWDLFIEPTKIEHEIIQHNKIKMTLACIVNYVIFFCTLSMMTLFIACGVFTAKLFTDDIGICALIYTKETVDKMKERHKTKDKCDNMKLCINYYTGTIMCAYYCSILENITLVKGVLEYIFDQSKKN